MKSYLDYLVAGGEPVPIDDGPTSRDIALLSEKSSAWAWLADEPDLYTLDDGQPI